MKVLFITIGAVNDFNASGAYTDLLKKFAKEGHEVFAVGALEKRTGKSTFLRMECGVHVLRVKIGNITKTNLIEKGLATLSIKGQYEKAIQRYWNDERFDLILYSTPPITVAGLISKLKKKNSAYTYLLLKDIFPQNAIDIGILNNKGIKGIAYKYFKHVERKLYKISDKIGCMSQANVDYIKKNNREIPIYKLEVCPNTIDAVPDTIICRDDSVLEKYSIPKNKYLLLYGGNFGKPQNVDYIIAAIDACSDIKNIHFILCGSGTDFFKVKNYIDEKKPDHITVIKQLPYNEYSKLVASCDVGLLFLDNRFTIPNFPSRLLDYMNYGLPVIAATDVNTDVGDVIVKNGFGWWIESSDKEKYAEMLRNIFESTRNREMINEKSIKARECLKSMFTTEKAYGTIMNAYKSAKVS